MWVKSSIGSCSISAFSVEMQILVVDVLQADWSLPLASLYLWQFLQSRKFLFFSRRNIKGLSHRLIWTICRHMVCLDKLAPSNHPFHIIGKGCWLVFDCVFSRLCLPILILSVWKVLVRTRYQASHLSYVWVILTLASEYPKRSVCRLTSCYQVCLLVDPELECPEIFLEGGGKSPLY